MRAYVFSMFCSLSSILFRYSLKSISHILSWTTVAVSAGGVGAVKVGSVISGSPFLNSPAPVYSLATYSAIALVVLLNISALFLPTRHSPSDPHKRLQSAFVGHWLFIPGCDGFSSDRCCLVDHRVPLRFLLATRQSCQ